LVEESAVVGRWRERLKGRRKDRWKTLPGLLVFHKASRGTVVYLLRKVTKSR
jgi:hypothetical protein